MSVHEFARRNADLDSCAREPIHLPGSIQPHGALLAIAEPELTVAQASENLEAVLGRPASEALCDSAASALGPAIWAELARRLGEDGPPTPPFRARLADTLCEIAAHRSEGLILVEIEPLREDAAGRADADDLRRFLARIQQTGSIDETGEILVSELRRLAEFDRVLLYRFDPDGHGSVIAENKRPDQPSYLGLHYPESDIPAQARALYRRNPIRVIPDARYEDVPLTPARRPDTGAPLDLSFAALRSVSPIHLEYLENFGVRAAMSLSILSRGELWGLITCSHEGPRYVSAAARADYELVARTASLKIAALEEIAEREERARRRESTEALDAAMRAEGARGAGAATTENEPVFGLVRDPDALLAATSAAGAAVCAEGTVEAVGRAPPSGEIWPLFEWICGRSERPPYSTRRLPQIYEPAERFVESASGVLAALLPYPREAGVLWFRPEVLQTVHWGGDPRKPVEARPQDARLHPRRSFEAWRELVRRSSRPWTAADREAAEDLRERMLARDLARQVERERRATRSREEILRVVSHDLKSPLSAIRLAAQSLAKSSEISASPRPRAQAERISRSAERASAMIRDLRDAGALEAGRLSLSPRPIDAGALVHDASQALSALAEQRSQRLRVHLRDERRVCADPDRIFQLLANLLDNAVKHTPPGGSIAVSVDSAGTHVRFAVADTGPGIESEEAARIFEPYRRGKGAKAEGAGLGLYIAHGIAEAHGGQLWVESAVGRGATFAFTLPAAAED